MIVYYIIMCKFAIECKADTEIPVFLYQNSDAEIDEWTKKPKAN